MAEFGEQLRKAREEKGITQQTLAEELYVTRQTISRYENGERYPDIVTLKKMSAFLGVSTDYLLCADLYFIKNIKPMMSLSGVIAIACFGIYREIQSAYHLLMIADHLYSWMNSLLEFLMITINVLFIYQAVILNIKRKQARDISHK